MKISYKAMLFALVSIIIPASFALGASAASGAGEQKFTQEELVSLSRPSVVRIVQHVQGEATFKPFSLDLDRMTISAGGGETKKVPIDEYMTGSGFIVSEDGYILTNSHVISDQQIKQEIVASVAQEAILNASFFSASFDQETSEPEKFEEYGKRVNDYLLKEGNFDFKITLVVLDPSSKKENILELVADGFPLSVVSVNDNYSKDNMDVALIKIDQKNLPSLPLGQTSEVKIGEKIGVFGFPSTAELNNKNPLTSTFSQGVVSAIRDSENKDFNLIQTDAKISDGSSGGPLLNEKGEVVGMITYQSNILEGSGGDNFAFALPIDVVRGGIGKFNQSAGEMKFVPGEYNAQFSKGLSSMEKSQCKEALASFERAKNANDKFNVSSDIKPYVERCQDLIAAGQSIDTKWDKIRLMMLAWDDWVWVIVVSVALLFVSIILKLLAMKKLLKEDEKEIVLLEEELKQNEQRDLEEMSEIKKIEKELDEMRKKRN